MATIIVNPGGVSELAIRDVTPPGFVGSVGVADQGTGNHIDWDWNSDGAWFMFGMMAIFWVGVIALGWWAIASYNRRHESTRERPIDVVRHRYARGEISAEEFERLKRDLG